MIEIVIGVILIAALCVFVLHIYSLKRAATSAEFVAKYLKMHKNAPPHFKDINEKMVTPQDIYKMAQYIKEKKERE